MKCPRDNTELFPQIYEADIEVDTCPSCHGIYLDKGELEQIQATVDRDYSQELKHLPEFVRLPDIVGQSFEMARQKEAEEIDCPHCQNKMEIKEHAYCSQVIIDVCPKCSGVWLDKGELKNLEIFFERNHVKTESLWRIFLHSILGKK